MEEIRYEAPTSLARASELLREPGAKPLAGGTDLIVQMRTGRAAPRLFVDVKRIPELAGIRLDADGIFVGAAVPAAEIVEHSELARIWPGLVEAVDLIGSTQIQGRATLGGNLCNASPAADSVPALCALGAVCVIAGPRGERRVPVESFNTAPGRNALAPGELLVGLRIPRPAPRASDAYLRFTPRTEMDIAVVGAAVALGLDANGVCTHARVALGAVAPTAILVPEAAAALVGSRGDDGALSRAAASASAAARPIADKRGSIEFRRRISGVLVRRAVATAFERARAVGSPK
ncbi:MAG: xanthine dehydrogenase family protein subunit M [Deltaproteobacteria bacterium]|nr:xanthine dehydrogenase family protein subunit M [Deltaproteobacteria bacterium]